jgi:hypothetical protein
MLGEMVAKEWIIGGMQSTSEAMFPEFEVVMTKDKG